MVIRFLGALCVLNGGGGAWQRTRFKTSTTSANHIKCTDISGIVSGRTITFSFMTDNSSRLPNEYHDRSLVVGFFCNLCVSVKAVPATVPWTSCKIQYLNLFLNQRLSDCIFSRLKRLNLSNEFLLRQYLSVRVSFSIRATEFW